MNIYNSNNVGKIITQWFGDCWHELITQSSKAEQGDLPNRFYSFNCIHCGINEANVNYLTPDGFFKLLKALEKKGITWKVDNNGSTYFIILYKGRDESFMIADNNLQEGFIKTVLKVIEKEEKENKTDYQDNDGWD